MSALEYTPERIRELRAAMTEDERAEFDAIFDDGPRKLFYPTPGPQMTAALSEADIIGFGGAAGGGKSALVAGLALEDHTRSLILRHQKVQTNKFVQDFAKVLGNTDGYSSQKSAWEFNGRLVEFGGLENPGDEEKWQGRDHDLKAFDEVTQMAEAQVRYVMGWARTDKQGQRVRVLMTFNPPTTAEGRWVIRFYAPWLDKKHPNPAKPGELRWFATVGENPDYELPVERRGDPFVIIGGEPVYDFNPADHSPVEIVYPKSRTFILSRVTDNPYYMATGYISTLQSLPEPLRSQMLSGDFGAGVEDDEWQVIPTEWVEMAMDRWRPRHAKGEMDSIGVDAARGGNYGSSLGAVGKDKMVISRRHGRWFDELVRIKGVNVNTGSLAAAQVILHRHDLAPVHIDVVGIGTSPYDSLCENEIHTIPMNGAAATMERDSSGLFKFYNLRALWWWKLREALDPANPDPLFLPDDAELLADLTAPRWTLTKGGILIESKDHIKKRLLRSPDSGDAVVYALVQTDKMPRLPFGATADTMEDNYNPFAGRR